MTEAYPRYRLELADTLLEAGRADIIYGKLWTLRPGMLRFKHGETIAELKVPYHMGADDEAVVGRTVLSLAALIKKRFEPNATNELLSTRSGGSPVISLPPLKDRTYLADIFIEDSLEKRMAVEILSSTQSLDSSILSAWLCPKGHGTALIKWVNRIFEKSLTDEARGGWEEPTSYLTLLAAVKTIRKQQAALKDIRVRGLSYEKLEHAVGVAMHVLFREALKSTLARLRDSGVSCYKPSVELLLNSAVVPKSFLSIPSSMLSGSLNPYSLNAETYGLLSPLAADFSEEVRDTARLIRATLKKIKNSQEVLGAVKLQHDIVRFRSETLAYLMEFDIPGFEAQRLLHELYGEDRVITSYLTEPKLCDDLCSAIDEVRKRFSGNPRKAQQIADYQRFLGSFRKSRLSGFLRSGRGEELSALETVLRSFYACRFDEHVERFEGLMRGYLSDRREEFDPKTLKDEYAKGRLYRFSTDDRAVLRTLEKEEEGQLFIDMKDFTRKTLKVKEIAMADFMKEYFYKPILTAASRYASGKGVLEDERGITLTNLPGDAAIFSGGVSYLVALARDIQKVIQRYKDNLQRRLPPRKGAELIEEVHKRFETKRKELREKRSELNEALRRNERGLEDRLIALGEEEHRLDNTYREELEAAIKGELEAGLYISYGAKAETMVIEGRDEFTGPVKVAIGEKINESARGTYRNSLVRAKLEILLENERHSRRKPDLKYPFDIYIDRIYSLRIPPELEGPFEKLVASRKPSGADAMTKIMSNEFHGDLKKIISGEPFSSLRLVAATTDIYNKGQALSREALYAYMGETKGTKTFFRKIVPSKSLARPIVDAFYFPCEELEIWFGVEMVQGDEVVEAFVRRGEVIFKGFEGNNPTVIYEMLNPEGDLCKALMTHHFKAWRKESSGPPEGEDF